MSDHGVDQGVGSGDSTEASYVHVQQVEAEEQSSDRPCRHLDGNRDHGELGRRVSENNGENETTQDGIIACVGAHVPLNHLLGEEEQGAEGHRQDHPLRQEDVSMHHAQALTKKAND